MSVRWTSLLLLFNVIAFWLGCVEGSSYVSQNKSDKVKEHLLGEQPAAISHEVMANFSDKVVLLGYDVDRDSLAPGEIVTVTWYWHCKAKVGPGWRLFTHVLDETGRPRLNRDRTGPIRKYYQPEHWRPGDIIRDIQQIRLSKEWDSKIVDLRTGIWKGKERLSGMGRGIDSKNRGIGPRMRVNKKKPKRIIVPRAMIAPEIDGAFEDEKAWKRALVLDEFSHTLSGKPASQQSHVRVMWDDGNLYLAMRAVDSFLSSEYTDHDDELWKADAFEIFLDPLGDKQHYYEIQVNPAGVVFDSYLPSHRKNTNKWTSRVRVKTTVDGVLNDDQEDRGWSAELAIPFASLNEGGGVPPTAETPWRMNLFLVDKTKGRTRYSAWSPPLRGDFHALDRFGEISFQVPSKLKTEPSAGSTGGEDKRKSDRGPSKEKAAKRAKKK